MRIVLVDDERLIVEGLKKIIGRKYPEMEIFAFIIAATLHLAFPQKKIIPQMEPS